jgi:hypothetical protein
VKQTYSGDGNEQLYQLSAKAGVQKIRHERTLTDKANDVLACFLPKGYPDSVSPKYINYAGYQFVAVTLGTATGVMSMQSLLFAVGIGGTASFPLAATLNWVMKDFLGQLGGLVFASVISNRFDVDPKYWRMVAAVAMDMSAFLELLSPLFPGYFLIVASVANAGKNISFIATSATRAAINRSFAVHENLGDVTAKAASQGTLAATVGSSLGIGLSALIGNEFWIMVPAFMVCSLGNLYSVYKATTYATLTTLIMPKLEYILHDYMAYMEHTKGSAAWEDAVSTGSRMQAGYMPLSPVDMNDREVYLMTPTMAGNLPELVVGADMNEVFESAEAFEQASLTFKDEQYLVHVNQHPVYANEPAVHLLLKENCCKDQMMKGLIHTFILRRELGAQVAIESKGVFSTVMKTFQRTTQSKQNQQHGVNGSPLHGINCSDIVSRTQDSTTHLLKTACTAKDGIFRIDTAEFLHRDWVIDELVFETRRARLS